MSAASTKKSGGKWKETRHDKYYHLAKEQGFRSRAAFKLIQLNKKYNFLGSCRSLLDLCAAPGGWLQVAAKTMPISSLIVGVDLLPIKAIRGVTTLKEDITTQTCRQKLKKIFNGWDCDVVVHDGAPNVGGSTWARDAYQQIELVIHSFKLATEFLREGGTFVTKVFRSQDYNSLLWVLNQFFKRCDVTKPAASRNASAEIFVVCQHYLAPKTIDPKLLDPQHIFQHFEDNIDAAGAAKNVHDVFKQKINPKPNRQGYDDHMPMHMTRTVPISTFIDADEPIVMLGTYNAFTMDNDADKMYVNHTDTTAEIKTLCEDLKVLGKGDFKSLLKWRKKMRDYRKQLAAEATHQEDEDDTEMTQEKTLEEKKEMEEKQLTDELEGLAAKQLKQKHKEKKKKREIVNKQRRRNLMNANNIDGVAETSTELDLFSMGVIPSEQALDTVADVDVGEEDEMLNGMITLNGEWDGDDEIRETDSEISQDDEDADYYEKLEGDLDSMYDQYRNRRKIVAKKQALSLDGEAEEDAEVEQEGAAELAKSLNQDAQEKKHNPLLIEFDDDQDKKSMAKEKAKRWFERSLFTDLDPIPSQPKKTQPTHDDDSDSSDADDEADDDQALIDMMDDDVKTNGKGRNKRGRDTDTIESMNKKPKLVGMSSLVSTTAKRTVKKTLPIKQHQDMSIFDDDEKDSMVPVKAVSVKDTRGSKRKVKDDDDEEDDDSDDDDHREDDFEEVAIESDYSDDSDARAEILAMGQLMLRKKSREGLINSAYNRYTYEDEDYIAEIDPKTGEKVIKKIELPEWFLDNENQHNKAQLPITKEEVALQRSKLAMINARPIKKIAEAKARQKMKTVQRWEKIQSKAMQIAQDDQIASNAEKMKAINKLMHKQDKKSIKKERNYVVAKKGGGTTQSKKGPKKGGLTVRVDRRMKADKRGFKSSEKRKSKKAKLANARKASRPRSTKGASKR